MKVTIDNAGECRKTVTVTVPAEDVRPEYERVVSLFMKSAKVPGFRPGKAPKERVQVRFRKQIIQEIQDAMLPTVYHDMLKKESIAPVALVGVHDVQLTPETGLSFRVILDVAPEFKLPKYQKLAIKAESTDVSDEDVDKAVQEILKRFSRYEDVSEGTVEVGDLAKVDYDGVYDGRPMTEMDASVGELASGKAFWLPMSSESEFVPGMIAGLAGVAIGETVTLNIDFPEDYRVKALSGKKTVYTFAVTALRKMREPELNEAFLKELDVPSMDELRKRIREDLTVAKAEHEVSRQKGEISRFLLENTKFEVPQSQVERESSTLLRSLLSRMAREGGSREMLEQHRDAIMGTVAQQASERVKLSYIIGHISEEEKIVVSEEEMSAAMVTTAERYRIPVEKLQAEIEKQEEGMNNFRNDIIHSKVLDFLLGQAKIKTT